MEKLEKLQTTLKLTEDMTNLLVTSISSLMETIELGISCGCDFEETHEIKVTIEVIPLEN